MTKSEVQALVIQKANQYGVPPNVALGIAAHESGFNPAAVNRSNANGTVDWGVMQLNDLTVQTMGVDDPLDPVQNVDAGVRLLASLLTRYGGDVRLALWAYASGPGNVGPNKTPNKIAADFIAYVMAYQGGPAPAAPGSSSGGGAPARPAVSEPAEPYSAIEDDLTYQWDATITEPGADDWSGPAAVGLGLVGLGLLFRALS